MRPGVIHVTVRPFDAILCADLPDRPAVVGALAQAVPREFRELNGYTQCWSIYFGYHTALIDLLRRAGFTVEVSG